MTVEQLASWRCESCKVDAGSDNEETTPAVLDILKGIQEEINKSAAENRESFAKLNESVKSIHETLAGIQLRMASIETENTALKEECLRLSKQNQFLYSEVNIIKCEFERFQQYSRNSNIEIKGVPQSQNEDIYNILELVAKVLRVPFNRADISTAHRLQKPRDEKLHPSIVVQFISRSTRSSWLTAARKLRITASDLVSTLPAVPVYVNEHLTRHNKSILGRAKYLVRTEKLEAAWTRDGMIFIRQSEGSPTKRVCSLEEVNAIAGVADEKQPAKDDH